MKTNQRWLHKCGKCEYSWLTGKEFPKFCPSCHYKNWSVPAVRIMKCPEVKQARQMNGNGNII